MNIVFSAIALLLAAQSAAPTTPAPAQPAHQHEHGMAHGAMQGDCCKDGRDCCKKDASCCQEGRKGDCCEHHEQHGAKGTGTTAK